MKKLFLISFLLISVVLLANAQNSTQARKALDKTASIIGRKGGASANFNISSTKYGNASGSIYIKGTKFYANTPKAIVWYNGKTQWTYMASTNEVNVSTPNQAKQLSMNPYVFINLYRSGYSLSMKTVGNNNQVHLVATDNKRTIKELYITINKSTSIPSQVKMKQDNTWTTINISNFTAKNINDNTFNFNAKDFPAAEIIDLR